MFFLALGGTFNKRILFVKQLNEGLQVMEINLAKTNHIRRDRTRGVIEYIDAKALGEGVKYWIQQTQRRSSATSLRWIRWIRWIRRMEKCHIFKQSFPHFQIFKSPNFQIQKPFRILSLFLHHWSVMPCLFCATFVR